MEMSEIEKSLTSQKLLEEFRSTILSEVNRREQNFHKALKRKRSIRYLIFTSLGLSLAGLLSYTLPLPLETNAKILLFLSFFVLASLTMMIVAFLNFKK